MKEFTKNIFAKMFSCMFIFSIVLGGGYIDVKAYSGSAAVSYAASHMASNHTSGSSNCPNSWQCAQFVSNCLSAGGLGNGIHARCRELYNDLATRGTVYTLTRGSMSSNCYSVPTTGNAANLVAGDAIISYCPTCDLYLHAVLVSGASGGYIYSYAHNVNKINQQLWISKCSSGHTPTIYGIHFNETTVSDIIPPTISNVRVTEVSVDGYTVLCDVTDNVGIDRVQFPTWTFANDQDDVFQNWGTSSECSGTWIGGSTYSYRVNRSAHNNEEGWYATHIYAYDSAGNSISVAIDVYLESVAPVISNIRVEDVSVDGYTVLCDIVDNYGIDRVQFPTWTQLNGQDDLTASWWNASECAGTWIGGNTYSYRVNKSEHNNELENYVTHIYAYDKCGNQVTGEIGVTCLLGKKLDMGTYFVASIQNNHADTVLTNDNRNVSGRKYQGNSNQKWIFRREDNGNYTIFSMADTELCLELDNFSDVDGGNVTVYPLNGTSAQKWKIYGDDSNGYIFVPEYSVIRALDLKDSSGEEGTNIQVWTANAGNAQCFKINCLATAITLNASELALEKGSSETLTAQIIPENTTNKNVIWTSADASIASVEDGIVKANAEGSTTIYARTEDGGTGDGKIIAQCVVTVTDETMPDTPNEDIPSGDIPNEDTPNEDVPSGDTPNEDTSSGDMPSEDTPKEDISSGDISSDNVPNVLTCTHTFKTHIAPASMYEDGSTVIKCKFCGVVSNQNPIYKIGRVNISNNVWSYNGRKKSANILAQDSMNNILEEGVDYCINYSGNCTDVGIYEVSVIFMGKYTGQVTDSITINPKTPKISKITAKKKSMLVKWIRDKQVSGYEIRYSLKANFSSSKKVKINKNSTVKKVIKKLKKNKRYYVSVRSYKNVQMNGKQDTLYSVWSTRKRSKKIK